MYEIFLQCNSSLNTTVNNSQVFYSGRVNLVAFLYPQNELVKILNEPIKVSGSLELDYLTVDEIYW